MTEMVCSRCGEAKPLSSFRFEKNRARFRTVCNECRNASRRDRYANDESHRMKAKAKSMARRQQIKASPDMTQAAREKRREYKRLGRICAKPGYKAALHDQHVKCWAASNQPPVLHDAHVQLAKADPLRWWHLYAKRQPGVSVGRRRRRAFARETLADSYMTLLLTNGRTSCPSSAGIPPALIELKRTHLVLVRYLNEQEGKSK